jgi:hypothetical protein
VTLPDDRIAQGHDERCLPGNGLDPGVSERERRKSLRCSRLDVSLSFAFQLTLHTCKEVQTGHTLHTLGYGPLLGIVLPRGRRSYTSDLLEGTRIAWNEDDRVTAWLLYELISLPINETYPIIPIPALLSI